MTQTVETFRGISLLILKWLLFAVLGIICLGVAAAAIAAAYQYVTYDRYANKVTIVFFTARDKCPDDQFPLLIGVINNSGKTLEKVSLELEARRPGYSTNLASYASYDNDLIIKPGEGHGACWRAQLQSDVKDDPRSLEWKVHYRNLTFSSE